VFRSKVDLTKFIEEHYFQFDNVFDADKDNQAIYETCVQPLVVRLSKATTQPALLTGKQAAAKPTR